MLSGTRSKSLISVTGEVIITEGFNVLGTHSKSLISPVGEVIITEGFNVLGYPFEIFDFGNG